MKQWGGYQGENLPIIGIVGPKYRFETQTLSNSPNTVINITERRTPASRRNTNNILNHFSSVVEFSKNLVRGESGHVLMRPSVNANVMTIHDTPLRFERPIENVGANVEHGSLLLVLEQEIVKSVVGAVGSIVKGETPRVGFRALNQVVGQVGMLRVIASVERPPTVWVRVRVGRGEAVKSPLTLPLGVMPAGMIPEAWMLAQTV